MASGFIPHPLVSGYWSCIVTGKSRSVRAPSIVLNHRIMCLFFQYEILLKSEYSNNFTTTICFEKKDLI